jgi:hypothetical protein
LNDIEIIRLGWAQNNLGKEDEMIPQKKKRFSIPQHRISRKSKKKKRGCCREECIAVPRNNRLEGVSSGYRRLEVP